MGYRSDVRLVTTKDGYEELEKYIKEQLEKGNDEYLYNVLEESDFREETKHFVFVGWDSVKYNQESYELLNTALEEIGEKGFGYSLVVNGEEIGDVQDISVKDKQKNYITMPAIFCNFDDRYTMKELEYEEERIANKTKDKEYECEL